MAASRPRSWRLSFVAALALLATVPAAAHWAMPSDAPIARLIPNIEAYTKEHPEEAQGYFVLGRVHSLAFTTQTPTVSVWEGRRRDGPPEGLPHIATDDFQIATWHRPADTPPVTREQLLSHLKGAVENLQRAVALDARPAEFHLSLGYTLDTGATHAAEAEVLPRGPVKELSPEATEQIEQRIAELGDEIESVRAVAAEALRKQLDEAAPLLFDRRDAMDEQARAVIRDLLEAYWRDLAAEAYLAAFERSTQEDSKLTERPLRGLRTLVSYEAGKGYVRLVSARGPKSDAEAARLKKVQTAVNSLDNLPESGIITPIVFSLGAPASLKELLDPAAVVRFDLDGDGAAELCPWVRPGTGILVWDPEGHGQITSGRQLFGPATWWLLFADGYHAMDALDNDRDGWLRCEELDGLAVWRDTDSDGVSDPGEVIPVDDAGIEAIATDALSFENGGPANPIGLRTSDGRTLPTYDWTTEAIPEPAVPLPPRN